jgi:hypothetical protein
MKTLYTQGVTTWKCADVGNLLETHGTLGARELVMCMTVSGVSLARGGAGGTTGSDGLAEHLERMNGFHILDFHLGFFFASRISMIFCLPSSVLWRLRSARRTGSVCSARLLLMSNIFEFE